MYRSRPSDDRARKWRQFCRGGWRMAWGFAFLWFMGLALLCRVAPPPAPISHEAPAPMAWWPASDGFAALDARTLWTPSAFALSSPAGFSHSKRRERAHLTPPVQVVSPASSSLKDSHPPDAFDLLAPDRSGLASAVPRTGWDFSESVFPPRSLEAAVASLSFSDGWESRLFSGIDLNYGAWSDMPWTAQMEIHFDSKGIPTSVLLARSSGLVEVDRRLARSTSAWRLLDPAAPRSGLILWTAPRGSLPASVEVPSAGEGEVL